MKIKNERMLHTRQGRDTLGRSSASRASHISPHPRTPMTHPKSLVTPCLPSIHTHTQNPQQSHKQDITHLGATVKEARKKVPGAEKCSSCGSGFDQNKRTGRREALLPLIGFFFSWVFCFPSLTGKRRPVSPKSRIWEGEVSQRLDKSRRPG